MIIPIVASISRELFLSVPGELKQGSLALGSTRWEMVRNVAIPQVSAGLVAAMILGLARALGEAIAVSQVIGGGLNLLAVHVRAGRHARRPHREPVPGLHVRSRLHRWPTWR